ncbi:MAG TPA: 50S ribosomal protein L10 [Solirubrobacteraceae bacterium]|nr:50S ribosomal protein L10 [Solirubrobacteraceae bacterium]
MNRDQKATAIADIAERIADSQAIFAVDYRGITVAQIAELRTSLRAADATFAVVKNSLTERAADQAGAEDLKDFLAGPTALTFVRGDAAVAAKAIADYARTIQLLPFKGGVMDGSSLDVDQIRALSKLPSREVLYAQLVGVVASPVGGLVRSLAALVSGLAVALGQVREKKESGEIPAGDPPAAAKPETPAAEAGPETPAAEAKEAPAAEAEEAAAGEAEAPPEEAPAAEAEAPAEEASEEPPEEASATDAPEAPAEEAPAEEAPPVEEAEEPAEEAQAEPAEGPAQEDDNDVSAEAEAGPEDADADTNKED